MRYYYSDDFIHIIENHQEEIIKKVRANYCDDIFDMIEMYLRGLIDDAKLIVMIKDYIIAGAEYVYESHDDAMEGGING